MNISNQSSGAKRVAEELSRNAIPVPTPETQHFWDGTAAGELRLQKCTLCAHVFFPPRPFCPACSSRSVKAFAASGRGTLYSYTINHVRPRDQPQAPQSMVLVQLEEGPRMISTVVGVEQTPAALILDMKLKVAFRQLSETIWLPVFKPDTGSS
jgi:uncharacterized OB-fold protein